MSEATEPLAAPEEGEEEEEDGVVVDGVEEEEVDVAEEDGEEENGEMEEGEVEDGEEEDGEEEDGEEDDDDEVEEDDDGGGGDEGSVGSEATTVEDLDAEFGEGGDASKKPNIPTHAIVRNVDLPEETKTDITDFVVASVEHSLNDPLGACKTIKESLDKVYGPGWHAVVGESFGFEISHDALHYVYVFFNGNLGILVWKCTANV